MEENHKEPNYVIIWLALISLTTISILVGSYIKSHTIAVILLFLLAIVKASLVALYFMHLKFERVTIISLVITPLVFFLIFLLGSMPDTIATKKLGEPKQHGASDH